MTSAANQIISRHSPVYNNGGNNNKRWAEIRTAKGIGAQAGKYAQMSGGGLANNTTTQPNFYSPFLTPSSFQIPNTRKEIYLWANWWRNNEPKVAAGINFYTNFPFNGWKLECKSNVVKDYFEKLIEKLNFQKFLPLISGSYHLYGDSFVLTEIDCPHCEGTMVDPNTGELCLHHGATWKCISLLNPDSVMITPGFVSTEPLYAYLPNDREIKVVMEGQPKELFQQIPEVIKAKIRARAPIPLDPMCIHHFKHGADYWSDYGISIIKPLFVTLAYKDKLRQAQWLIAERHIIPTKIVTVGDQQRPASQADLDSVQDQLSAVANDPNLTLVVPHAFDYKFVGASGEILQVSNEFELLDQEILDGLMLSKALLNGEGPNVGNGQVGLMAMNERLETWRREVSRWIEQKIFKPCAEWNGFYSEGDGGQKELIYPKIVFDNLKLKDSAGVLQQVMAAHKDGILSAETVVEELGYSWDQEVERLRFEQGMNFVNSSDVMDTDMNIGFGGIDGNGFGAGLNQPMSGDTSGGGMDMGAPPDASGMGGDMSGGGMDAGGAAPAPGAPMPTAESNYKQYKFASQLMNEIAFNRTTIASLNEREFLNPIDKELNERSAVSGRGNVGEINENLPPVAAWNWKPVGVPLNYHAQKMLKTSAVNEKKNIHGYTSIEKKLYHIVMKIGSPLGFYAQYEAGPSKEYTLDGAFPQIKLGVEADGEIWHNNPNKLQSDRKRDMTLSQQGWTILRFTDKELNNQPEDVAVVIKQALMRLLQNVNGGGQAQLV